MQIRPTTSADLSAIVDIDATAESSQYLHIERTGEGLDIVWRTQIRPLRERRTHRHALNDDQRFALKQIVHGIEDGIALVAEHDDYLVASIAAVADSGAGILRLFDLRVDFDHRRQGLGSALLFQLISQARERELRAVMARAAADEFPVLALLGKLNFEPAGLDTHFRSNHDLVKEAVTLFFYLALC